MVQANIHFTQDSVTVEFEGEYAFVKWLGYLKEHGFATVKRANGDASVIVFRDNITYIEHEGEPKDLKA
ncbi:hypothetical protein D3C78_1453060 [compost metagenome]